MSSQNFSAIEREAIWRAYSQKCVYSRGLLDISNFHIDHIVPEVLLENPIKFEKALKDCGLDDNFDILGWENLVPCQPGMNLQKSSIVFEPSHARYFLGIAEARKPEVVEEIAKIERARKRGKAIVMLQQTLETGKLKPEEVARILQDHIGVPDEIFELLEAMTLPGLTELRSVARTDLENLRDQPVNLVPSQDLDGVELTGPNEEKRTCRTCREYDVAIGEGYYALTTFDIKMATRFEHRCGLLASLQQSKPPIQSFVSSPRVSILDLDLLPYSLFPVMTNHEDNAHMKSYQDLVNTGDLIVRQVRGNLLKVEEQEGMGQILIEVVRADFNGDGIEDILLFEYCYATHGTLGFGGVRLITRFAVSEKFTVLNAPI